MHKTDEARVVYNVDAFMPAKKTVFLLSLLTDMLIYRQVGRQ